MIERAVQHESMSVVRPCSSMLSSIEPCRVHTFGLCHLISVTGRHARMYSRKHSSSAHTTLSAVAFPGKWWFRMAPPPVLDAQTQSWHRAMAAWVGKPYHQDGHTPSKSTKRAREPPGGSNMPHSVWACSVCKVWLCKTCFRMEDDDGKGHPDRWDHDRRSLAPQCVVCD